MHDAELNREQLLQELATLRHENALLRERERRFGVTSDPLSRPLAVFASDITGLDDGTSPPGDYVAAAPAGSGCFVFDITDGALSWSQHLFAAGGGDRAAFSGNLEDMIAQTVHPDDRADITAQYTAMLQQHRTWPVTFRAVTPDGVVRWLRSDPQFVFDDSGTPVRAFGLHHDITPQIHAAETAQESEAIFSTVFQAIPDAAMLWQRLSDGEIVLRACNDAAVLWSAGRAAQLLGKSLDDFFPAGEEAAQHIRQTFDSGTGQRLEVHSASPISGAETWGIANYTQIGTTLVLHIITDITERVEAEQARRASETRFRAVFENAAVGISISGPNGRTTHANARLQEMLGYSESELQTRDLTDLTHPEDLPAYLAVVQDFLSGARDTAHLEKRMIRRDGHPVWVSLAMSLVRDAHGVPWFGVGVAADITERKQAEEALRESEQRYRLVTENVYDVIWTSDNDYRLTYVSPSVSRLLGYEPEELYAMSWADLVSPESHAQALRAISARTSAEEDGHNNLVNVLELEYLRKDGVGVWCTVTTQPLLDDTGRRLGVLGVIHDISKRKRLDAQLMQAQKMEAVGRLAGGVTHDFNNILTVIAGYTDFLLGAIEERDARRLDLLEVRKATERASGLTRQLLAFSRRQVLELSVLDLNDLVTNIATMLGRIVGEDIAIVTNLAPTLRHIEVDAGQIEQVIMNLAVNARNAMPHGGRLLIETRDVNAESTQRTGGPELPPGDYVLLRVSDDGIGMDEATLAHIFEPFFTTSPTGTGLGLATVYGIVAQSGGHIGVESRPMQGATFSIYLPAVQHAASPGPATPAAGSPARGTETVLLVEDEKAVRDLASRALRNAGYTVLAAADGNHALHICRTHDGPIHLLLTDVVLPSEMNGVQVADAVAVLRPGIRVVHMSGYPLGATSESGLPLGDIDVLPKPFTTSVLLSRVRSALDD